MMCKDYEEVAVVLQEKLPKYKLTNAMPTFWLNQFEANIVELVEMHVRGIDLENLSFNLLPFFLHEEDSHWFFIQRSKLKKPWSQFKKDFVSHFSNQYWKMTKEALCSSFDGNDEGIYDFICSKVESLELLFPELHHSSIIKMCCASVPDDYACEFEDSIDQGLAMFKQRVKAFQSEKAEKLAIGQEVGKGNDGVVDCQANINNMFAISMQNFLVSDSFKTMMATLLQPKATEKSQILDES